jgi:hypothetical protein
VAARSGDESRELEEIELMMVNLEQLYAFVNEYIGELQDRGRGATAKAVERALRGCTTAREILGGLGVAPGEAAREEPGDERVRDALSFIESALGPPRATNS